MKLFKTSNIDTDNYCRTEFQFELPCIVLEQRRRKFLANENLYSPVNWLIIVHVKMSL